MTTDIVDDLHGLGLCASREAILALLLASPRPESQAARITPAT